MNIRAWSNFTKRINSTKQPAAADGRQISCYLKEDTSIRNPSFILADPMPSITYVQAFGNYYFVTDIVNLDANRAEVACSLDVLATYRASILGYTAFVERSSSNYDTLVIDPLLSSRQDISSIETATRTVDYFSTTGSFVVQAFSKGGGIVLYATVDMTPYEKILDTNTYTSADILEWIDKKVAQAFDLDVYIGAVKWLPISPNHIGQLLGTSEPFYIGPVDIGVPSGYLVYKSEQRTPIGVQIIYDIPIPSNNAYNDFRDYSARFSSYKIRLAGIGYVSLDPTMIGSIIHSSDTLVDWMYIDYISGDITHELRRRTRTGSGENSVTIGRYNGNIAVNVPITKSSPDNKPLANIIDKAGQGAQVGGGYGAIAGAIVGLVDSVAKEFTPETSFVGSSSENMALIRAECQSIITISEKFGSKEFATSVAGRPLFQNITLGNLSGFCKCGNASVPVNARDDERAEINSYLNSGFYIE